MRTISLPAINKRVSLGAYLCAVRHAKASPRTESRHGLTTWWPTTGAEILKQFHEGMFDRINAGIPYSQRGL